MNHVFIFIIWHKALWCRRRIISDIILSFDIVSEIDILWDKAEFENNLKAFYGCKMVDPRQKVRHCGLGSFKLLIVCDKNPRYDVRNTPDGSELVNVNMFDKKELYRKWTGGGHRIHCSNTEAETKHDLTILLGLNYKQYYHKTSNLRQSVNTVGVEGFQDVTGIILTLDIFPGAICHYKNGVIFVFAYCRTDIVRGLLCCSTKERCRYYINVRGKREILYIYGEREADIPPGFLEICQKGEIDTLDFIERYGKEYQKFICNKINQIDDIRKLFEQKGLDVNITEKSPFPVYPDTPLRQMIISAAYCCYRKFDYLKEAAVHGDRYKKIK